MHMADALLSPAVGGVMLAASTATIAYSSVKVKNEIDTKKIPLMGVLGAFIFAAQMINFSIPGTGSSGHIGGGMILAILLGPYAAFLTIAAVLIIQALFFADGGLLALGCNIFNLGFFPCFIAYPLIYKLIKNDTPYSFRSIIGTILAVVIGLQLGALSVVIETVLSGISVLRLDRFLLLMLPIHLAIGCIEGFITVTVVNFLWKARPDILENQNIREKEKSLKNSIIPALFLAALLTGGVLSWFASSHPDGLEWALFHTTGNEELESPDTSPHTVSGYIQEKTSILPDYNFKHAAASGDEEKWPSISAGTTISGIIGSIITLAVILLFGFLLYYTRKKKCRKDGIY